MSHELRTPLNSLLILSQMLSENKKGNLDDKQVEYARTIHHSGADLLTLINDILDLSKVEAGRIEIHPEDVRLDAITTSLDQKFRHMAEQKGLQFHINLAGNLPATVHIDEQRVRQILTNLLGNSFKFTHEGGITLDISRPETGVDLSRSGLDPKRTIAYSVSDTGIGIAKEKQKVIFEAFQQADGSVNRKYGGTGLGLSISRQLVNLLGGEIQLHSEPGKGSRFSVYLPERMRAVEEVEAEKPAARPAPAPAPKAKSGEARGKEKTVALEQAETPPIHDDRDKLKTGDKSILIIEDDRGFSNILVELGREKQFKCLLAEDGRAGLELAEKYQPSAIMLDLGLPLVDGWTVMERLKDNPQTRHIPVHFVSGADYSIDARRMGAIGYSLKPVSMAELGEAFKKIESFVSKAVKNLLIVTDDKKRQKAIEELVKGMDAAPTLAHTRATAWKELNLKTFDCLVLDVDTEQGKGVELLEQMHNTTGLSQVPVVIYAERELSETEHALIQKCTANVTIKEAYSGERLLDEATLFLHQVESKLPQEKQKILRKARDKEGVLAGKKVLLVDDDARNVFALSAALEEKGMEVLAAANGKEALEVLDEHPETDVVLMDIMMPEMDGYEATKRIRGKLSFNKLPIIALTAKAMKGDKAKCIEAGANDYLPKPVEPARLLSLLRVWLAK
jgi:CheY-like chemotaxis protein